MEESTTLPFLLFILSVLLMSNWAESDVMERKSCEMFTKCVSRTFKKKQIKNTCTFHPFFGCLEAVGDEALTSILFQHLNCGKMVFSYFVCGKLTSSGLPA